MTQRMLLTAIVIFGILGCSPEEPESDSSLAQQETIGPSAQSTESILDERPETIAWGPTDPSGLQLGIWLSEDQERVMGVIRNQGDKPVPYCDYFVGYVQAIRIDAQESDGEAWQQIGIQDGALVYLKGAGPSANNVHEILPADEMPPEHWDEESLEQARKRNPNRTLTIYLFKYEWPESWSGPINIVISQRFINDGEETVWTGTLKSAPIRIDVSELKKEQSKLPTY